MEVMYGSPYRFFSMLQFRQQFSLTLGRPQGNKLRHDFKEGDQNGSKETDGQREAITLIKRVLPEHSDRKKIIEKSTDTTVIFHIQM